MQYLAGKRLRVLIRPCLLQAEQVFKSFVCTYICTSVKKELLGRSGFDVKLENYIHQVQLAETIRTVHGSGSGWNNHRGCLNIN